MVVALTMLVEIDGVWWSLTGRDGLVSKGRDGWQVMNRFTLLFLRPTVKEAVECAFQNPFTFLTMNRFQLLLYEIVVCHHVSHQTWQWIEFQLLLSEIVVSDKKLLLSRSLISHHPPDQRRLGSRLKGDRKKVVDSFDDAESRVFQTWSLTINKEFQIYLFLIMAWLRWNSSFKSGVMFVFNTIPDN